MQASPSHIALAVKPNQMKELHYKVTDADGNSLESDSVKVGNPNEWAKAQMEECAFKSWSISIWDDEGNSYPIYPKDQAKSDNYNKLPYSSDEEAWKNNQ